MNKNNRILCFLAVVGLHIFCLVAGSKGLRAIIKSCQCNLSFYWKMSQSSKQKTVNKGRRALCECVCERQQLAARSPEQPLMWAANEGQKLRLCCSFTSAEFYLSNSFIELSKGKGISQSHSLTETGQVLFGDKLLALNYNIPHLLTFSLLRSWNSKSGLWITATPWIFSFSLILLEICCCGWESKLLSASNWIQSKTEKRFNLPTNWNQFKSQLLL